MKAWNRYWFSPAPLLNLAVLRILCVGFTLYWLAPCVSDWATLSALPESQWHPPLLIEVLFLGQRPPLWLPVAGYAAMLATGVLAGLGAWTRVSLPAFAVLSLACQSYQYSWSDYHHAEALMELTLIALACAPSGELLSVDAVRRRLRAQLASGRVEPIDLEQTSPFALWPVRLVMGLFALIYLSAALHKLGWPPTLDWVNGYTLRWYLTQHGMFSGNAWALWMASWPVGFLAVASVGALLFEGTFWIGLVFPRLLPIYLLAGIGLHVGIYVTLRAPFPQYVLLLAGLGIPWSRVFAWARQGETALRVYYDDDCPLCLRTMTILQAFDWLGRLAYRPISTQTARAELAVAGITPEDARVLMHVLAPGERAAAGFSAFARLSRALPIFWPISFALRVPIVDRTGSQIYRAIAARRTRTSACEGRCAPRLSA